MGTPLIYQRSVAQDLYAWALSTAYQSYRVYDTDYALSNEPDIFELVLRDPVINHAVNLRLHAVAARKWRMMPASDSPEDMEVASICEKGLKNIRGFTEARKNMALAVLRARTFQKVRGKRMLLNLSGTGDMPWWVPTDLQDVDRRRFRIVPVWSKAQPGIGNTMAAGGSGRQLSTNVEMWSVAQRRWEPMSEEEKQYYVKVIFGDEEARLGYGRGIIEALYFYHWIKGLILEQCLQGVERWAQGWVTVRIDGLRRADPTNPNNAQATTWLNIINQHRSRHALVMDKNDEVDVHETSGTGHQLCMEVIRYLDEAMVALILGSVLPFGGSQREGSKARAETEREVSESLIQFDRDKIDEDITEDLVGLFWKLNFQNFVELGLEKANRPTFETIQETHKDIAANAQLLVQLLGAGLKIREDEGYHLVELTPPKEGDKVIEATPSMMGGEGDFSGGPDGGGGGKASGTQSPNRLGKKSDDEDKSDKEDKPDAKMVTDDANDPWVKRKPGRAPKGTPQGGQFVPGI